MKTFRVQLLCVYFSLGYVLHDYQFYHLTAHMYSICSIGYFNAMLLSNISLYLLQYSGSMHREVYSHFRGFYCTLKETFVIANKPLQFTMRLAAPVVQQTWPN
jgi:hypothetical protein